MTDSQNICYPEHSVAIEAYRTMRLIRSFEDRVAQEFATGAIPGFVHLYAGQEASAVGVCMHLREDDRISSTHRGHGHCIAKGCDINGMMSEIYGKKSGLCGGKGGSMHIADLSKGMMGANAIVGGGPPLACGAALAAKTLGTGGIAVTFTGDGGANQGTTLESMNLASVWQLPVLFVFENNGYAESTAADYSIPGGSIARRADAFCIPSAQVDGIDFFEVYRASGDAVARIRDSGGPFVLEIMLTRFYGHHQGDQQVYRGAESVRRARQQRDCLKKIRDILIGHYGESKDEIGRIDLVIQESIEAAVRQAQQAPPPDDSDLTTDVYVSY